VDRGSDRYRAEKDVTGVWAGEQLESVRDRQVSLCPAAIQLRLELEDKFKEMNEERDSLTAKGITIARVSTLRS
jgi:hypothetical protein